MNTLVEVEKNTEHEPGETTQRKTSDPDGGGQRVIARNRHHPVWVRLYITPSIFTPFLPTAPPLHQKSSGSKPLPLIMPKSKILSSTSQITWNRCTISFFFYNAVEKQRFNQPLQWWTKRLISEMWASPSNYFKNTSKFSKTTEFWIMERNYFSRWRHQGYEPHPTLSSLVIIGSTGLDPLYIRDVVIYGRPLIQYATNSTLYIYMSTPRSCRAVADTGAQSIQTNRSAVPSHMRRNETLTSSSRVDCSGAAVPPLVHYPLPIHTSLQSSNQCREQYGLDDNHPSIPYNPRDKWVSADIRSAPDSDHSRANRSSTAEPSSFGGHIPTVCRLASRLKPARKHSRLSMSLFRF